MKLHIKNIFTKAAVLFAIATVTTSCKKGYFYPGINDDPTQLQKPVSSNLLPGIIESTGYEWGGDASRFTSEFMQQTTGVANQSALASNYNVSADDVDNMWTGGLYGGGIMNNDYFLIKIADAAGQTHYAAVARILMANALGLTTDLWGDIPYTEAFQGTANLQPHYDTQQSIYTTIDNLLSTAITALTTSENTSQPGSDDVLYNGDLQKWLRFAHTLRAKMYLHLVKVDATYYDKALTEAALGFTSAADNAGVPFAGSSVTSQNPWYQFNTQRGDIAFTGYIYDLLTANKDPRLSVYSDGSGGLGTLYGSPNSTVYLLSYDELLFIKAEAQFQKGDKVSAAASYNAAVTANLLRTVNSAAYATTVAKTAANITLNDIMTQKYIANFLNPEVWTDWRRTGLPVLTAPPSSALNGSLPRSLLYPSGEERYNSNAPKNTSMLRRVWWDK
ncbi:SusD/RagB family nutrient-binding outer membrane lipoprotein [Mucilaginibacter arboris]|uniref:SusD/RagB family nutrient-binding outer membrane lipoprotein n=1 Tax=Mucilaginibacter arboris TaxID=2682090 RepID=A0A7K1SW51_9SPHI|nr:SusD/RagB family nutrient-binding outer membrane lipoprotein [Mucilaginibacter arboris]MVN21551.1 SusD/RagB family nutrient-binding outer membrane lipoprotein [Mucilaginibacter arboris]